MLKGEFPDPDTLTLSVASYHAAFSEINKYLDNFKLDEEIYKKIMDYKNKSKEKRL